MLEARKKQAEEAMYQQWVVQLPVMAISGEYVSFEAYKEKLTGSNIDRRPSIEILRELDELEKTFEEGEK